MDHATSSFNDTLNSTRIHALVPEHQRCRGTPKDSLPRNKASPVWAHLESILQSLRGEALHHLARGLGLHREQLAEGHALARLPRWLAAKLDHGHPGDGELT